MLKRARAHLLITALALSALQACDLTHPKPGPAASSSARPKTESPASPVMLAAELPDDRGPYYPSLLRSEADKPVDVRALADVTACGRCHEEAAHEWASSAHARASFDNPWYRASVDAVRRQIGFEASRHCGGCHDPSLLLAGKMDSEVRPDDPLAFAGVTCLVCHSIRAATRDGNASFTLTTDPVPIPKPGDADSLRRHRERLAPMALRKPELCASCHRAFLGRQTGIDHHLLGIDEPGVWSSSAWGGSRGNTLEDVPKRTCTSCHMSPEIAHYPDPVAERKGSLKSHRFAGSHTAIAAQSGDPRQLAAVIDELRRSVVVEAPVVWVNRRPMVSAEPVALEAGDDIALDVTIRNGGVGHEFPGGVKDLQETWVELDVRDATGREVVKAGKDQERREDPTAFVLRALVVDASGRPEARHIVTHFGTVAYDHTVAPLSARVVRYTFTLPAWAEPPLAVAVRVRHRKHNKDARELACEASRSARGREFMAEARRVGTPILDGCLPEPVVDIGSAELTIGPAPVPSPAARPLWAELYDHALALSRGMQERLDEARFSANRALRELESDPRSDPGDRANVLALLGRIAAKQERLDEALELSNRARALVGDQPAIERVRADAYAEVWHWPQAAAAFADVSAASPIDTEAFRDLALARMSAADARGALAAAQTGLHLQPRDEALLRVQTLALEAEHSSEAPGARRVFIFYRQADETTTSRLACDRMVPTCERDRVPVVTIALAAPPS